VIYENWRNNKIEGYVINGLYFMGGFREYMFLKPSSNYEKMLNDVLLSINQKYVDEMYSDIVGIWLHGSFLKYGKWIPTYSFQVPCKTKESAIKIANELVTKFKNIIDNPVCIAIAGGEIMINYDDLYNCDGVAYIKSGRFIDSIENCRKMIRDEISLIVI
jgi:hypothetical protein